MAKHSLVIVESPAKAKTIGKYLGKEFEVKACMGHLRDLPRVPWAWTWSTTSSRSTSHQGKEDIIADLKKSAKSRGDGLPCHRRTGRERPSPGT